MITPYITFCGECTQALALYQAAFRCQPDMVQYYDDYVPQGVENPPPGLGEWVLHAEMTLCGTAFWFADEIAQEVVNGTQVKLTASVPTTAEAARIFQVLSVGASITLPPTRTFYSALHAGLVDRFGVGWNIVSLEPPVD